MNLFDRRSTALLLLVALPLFFLPKVNLIGFANETAGIRLDDLVLAGLAFVIGFAHISLRKQLLPIERWLLGIVGVCFASFLLNKAFVSLEMMPFEAKIFYCLRMFEYFLFFYVGLFLWQMLGLNFVMLGFLWVNVVVMTLQKLGIMGEFNAYGYQADAAWRLSGLASFPNEMAACLNLVYCYLTFRDPEPSRFFSTLPLFLRRFWESFGFLICFLFFAFLILLTGSRISLIALGVTFLWKFWNAFKAHPRRLAIPILAFLPVAIVTVIETITNTDSLFYRSAQLFSWDNIEQIAVVWNYIDPNDMQWEELSMVGTIDKSWWMRLHKWCHAIKLFANHPESWLFGVGPGLTSAGLDGGLLRIFIEHGFVGTYVFYRFFKEIYKQSEMMKWMIIAFVINNMFIDIYLAYKPMSLLFLTSGYVYAQKQVSTEPKLVLV